MRFEYHRHNLGQAELEAVKAVFESIFITTGPVTKKFEELFAKYFDAIPPYYSAVAVTNCTNALHMALYALGIGAGDEVITTPLSFMATANAILYTGAKPVFVDVEPETGNINADQIETCVNIRTKAILPVHLYGHMCDMKKIADIAERHGLSIVEDSAHCIEGIRDSVLPGQLSNAACFSFHALKTLTCGEGGAIITRDEKLANKLRQLRSHNIDRSALDRSKSFSFQDIDELGFKCNLPDIASAQLIPQLDRIELRLKRREVIAHYYTEALKDMVDMPGGDRLKTRHAHCLFTIWVDPAKRDRIRQELNNRGIGTNIQYYPIIPLLTYYRKEFGYTEGMFPNAELISSRTIALPFYPLLTDDEVQYVIECVKSVVRGL